MNQTFTEKEILGDALAAQKASTTHFNSFANECVHENVRQVMMDILNEEHDIQQDVFCTMHDKGYYPTPAAEEKKVNDTKQRYCQCVKDSSCGCM